MVLGLTVPLVSHRQQMQQRLYYPFFLKEHLIFLLLLLSRVFRVVHRSKRVHTMCVCLFFFKVHAHKQAHISIRKRVQKTYTKHICLHDRLAMAIHTRLSVLDSVSCIGRGACTSLCVPDTHSARVCVICGYVSAI